MTGQKHDRGIDRRQFLKLLGAAGITAVAGGTVLHAGLGNQVAAAESKSDAAGHQWAMVIDLRRCDGCENCTRSCGKMHYLPKEQKWIKVYELTSSTGQKFHLPRPCMQCENPPCKKVCPVKATFQSPDGVVLVDQNRCIGCRLCMGACPYEARYFNFSDPPPTPSTLGEPRPEFPVPQKRGTVGKCVLCVHNLRYGKLPVCVENCTMEALYIGDFSSDIATNGREGVQLSRLIKENDAFRLKEELNTRPRVYYIAGHGQEINF